MVVRNILPDLVFGRLFTITAFLKKATGPNLFLTMETNSLSISSSDFVQYMEFITNNPKGTCPRSLSRTPTTATSATSGWSDKI